MESQATTVYVNNVSHFNIAANTSLIVRALERGRGFAQVVTLERSTGSDVLVCVRAFSMTSTYVRISLRSGEATLVNTGRNCLAHDALVILRALSQVRQALKHTAQ